MKRIFFKLIGLLLLFTGCKSHSEKQSLIKKDPISVGAAVLMKNQFSALKGKKVGLVTNHSAVVNDSLLIDILYNAPDVHLKALFSPEHGIRGKADAGAHIDNSVDTETGVPIYSLYGKARKPTPEMLKDIDVMVFDIQDVGARFYTYIATMGYTMQAAAENDIPYIVLDRPNPLGGELIEGFIPELEDKRFNGLYPIPVTHGMTVGELARMIKGESYLKNLEQLDLEVIEMKGWERNMLWSDMNLSWTPPSPNIPDFETALIYPGACLIEATHISEGRGTMQPFMQIGAGWSDGEYLAKIMNNKSLPGLEFKAATFTPEPIEGMDSNPKLEGTELSGIKYKIKDPHSVKPVAAGIHMLLALYNSAPDSVKRDFFRADRLNTLAGSNNFYKMVKNGRSAGYIIRQWKAQLSAFKAKRESYLLY